MKKLAFLLLVVLSSKLDREIVTAEKYGKKTNIASDQLLNELGCTIEETELCLINS